MLIVGQAIGFESPVDFLGWWTKAPFAAINLWVLYDRRSS